MGVDFDEERELGDDDYFLDNETIDSDLEKCMLNVDNYEWDEELWSCL